MYNKEVTKINISLDCKNTAIFLHKESNHLARTTIGNTSAVSVKLGPRPNSPIAEHLATQSLGHHVEALGLVVGTSGDIVSEDGHIHPGGGMPVRVVVPLLWALVATPVAIGILAGEGG